jgi:hypothetical protein
MLALANNIVKESLFVFHLCILSALLILVNRTRKVTNVLDVMSADQLTNAILDTVLLKRTVILYVLVRAKDCLDARNTDLNHIFKHWSRLDVEEN